MPESLTTQGREARWRRYFLQTIARKALPFERVTICCRNRITPDNDVEIWKHLETQNAFYGGLMVCGSVWTCPVCASKISERRRQELKQALDIHKESGGKVAMLTLTFSHKWDDNLLETLKKFTAATKRFRSGKRYKNVMDKLGRVGTITTFEITWGKNGFHPHIHMLIFYNSRESIKKTEMELFELWQKACNANNLLTSFMYGLTLQRGDQADKYISKWGLDQELTKSHIKKGKEEGLTPFDFLRRYAETENEYWLHLFRDYAYAMKGKSQLRWSKGLKAKFLLQEKTDEQIAEEKTEPADLFGIIDFMTWKKILHMDKRTEFLELCEETTEFSEAIKQINKLMLTDYKNKKLTNQIND